MEAIDCSISGTILTTDVMNVCMYIYIYIDMNEKIEPKNLEYVMFV